MLASVSAAMSTSLLPSVVIQRLQQYLPIIHLVFANLKTWDRYRATSTCLPQRVHLPLQQAVLPVQRLPLIAIAGDTSAPTYAELYSGEWRHPTCSGHGR